MRRLRRLLRGLYVSGKRVGFACLWSGRGRWLASRLERLLHLLLHGLRQLLLEVAEDRFESLGYLLLDGLAELVIPRLSSGSCFQLRHVHLRRRLWLLRRIGHDVLLTGAPPQLPCSTWLVRL